MISCTTAKAFARWCSISRAANDSGALQPGTGLSEADYLQLWRSSGLGQQPPALAALTGGALADRPAWVFVAGYQAAIRAVFTEVESDGWLAFAVSEDRDNPQLHPPVVASAAEAEWLLTGTKTWVAQAAHVSELLVTARLRDRTELFRVSADMKGLQISQRPQPTFLAAMSQGIATFEQTPAARLNAPDRRAEFATAEALAMMIAACGYLAAVTAPNSEASGPLAQLRACLPRLQALLSDIANVDAGELLSLDQRFHQAFSLWCERTDVQALPDFQADRKLFSLYRRGIAKRAQAATIQVPEPD